MNSFFSRHSFKVILAIVCLLPLMTRGARYALTSNDNNVQDWLPKEYEETQQFKWFRSHFENETFVLVSWDGCTLGDERLELFAQKVVGLPETQSLCQRVETGQRLLKRLTEADEQNKRQPTCSEDEALERLSGLFVGPRVERGAPLAGEKRPQAGEKPVEAVQSCAVVTLTELGKKDLRNTLFQIKRICTHQLAIKPNELRMGGPPVDNVAISVEGERTLMWLLAPAGAVGIALAFWCLRSVRLTTMVFSVALYAGAVSLAVVTYSGGTMNAILLTMPAVVYVAGISGAIHFANYYRDSVVEQGVAGAPARAIRHAWLPCTLSAVTTAAGLISLYTSELVPIKFFGVYSAVGVLATLGLLFLFLPAWMQLWPMRAHSLLDGDGPAQEDLALPARWRRFLQGVLGRHRLVFAALGGLMIFCGYGLTKVNTSIKLTKLFSSKAEIIQNYEWLEAKLGPLVPMEVIVRIENAACGQLTMLERMRLVHRLQDRLREIPDIGNTLSAVTFAPSLKEKKGFAKSIADSTTNKQLVRHRQEFIDGDLLAEDEGEELWRISARVAALNDIDYGLFIEDIKRAAEPVLQQERERLEKLGATSADGSFGIRATYTGLVPVVYKAQRAMLEGLAWNFLTDLATIAVVMTVVFWDIWAGVILLIPSVFPVVIVFGLMGWFNVVIDVGTILTPTVALGVSVDDVVHFLIWYRQGLRQGKSRREAIMLAYEGCARAMYQSWAVLGLGLFVFALSSFVPTQRFGALMFALLSAALVGNLLMLPAVLASPIAYFFGRRAVRQAAELPPGIEPAHARQVPPPLGATTGESSLAASQQQLRRDGAHRATSS